MVVVAPYKMVSMSELNVGDLYLAISNGRKHWCLVSHKRPGIILAVNLSAAKGAYLYEARTSGDFVMSYGPNWRFVPSEIAGKYPDLRGILTRSGTLTMDPEGHVLTVGALMGNDPKYYRLATNEFTSAVPYGAYIFSGWKVEVPKSLDAKEEFIEVVNFKQNLAEKDDDE